MTNYYRHLTIGLSALLCISFFSGSLFAGEWPMFRRDPQRTAYATGDSSIKIPSVAWKFHLGGALASDAQWVSDVNGDGTVEIVLIEGGRLAVKLTDDTVVWTTVVMDLFRIEMVGDIDQRGDAEIVASGYGGKIIIFSGFDGDMVWQTPSGLFDHIGAVRWADMNADGLEDMYVANMAGGYLTDRDVAVAFSFANGTAAPVELFSLETGVRDYVVGINDSVGDFDGDGDVEILVFGTSHAYLFSTRDGTLKALSGDIGYIPYGQADTVVRDVDWDGADELVCYTNNSNVPLINSRKVFLIDWAGGSLTKRWEVGVADVANDQHVFVPNGLSDPNNDGRWELVTSFKDGLSGEGTTHIFDAISGSMLDTIPDALLRGVVELDGDPGEEILVEDPERNISCYKYLSGSLTVLWTLPSIWPIYSLDVNERKKQSATGQPLALDLNGDGFNELIVELLDAEENVLEIQALDVTARPPVAIGRYSLDQRAVLTVQPFYGISEPDMQVTMARSDGYFIVFDHTFYPINEPTEYRTGLRFGGYYSGSHGWGKSPVAADLGSDGYAEVIAMDSKGDLIAIDPSEASIVRPPSIVWERKNEMYPTIIDLEGDGIKEVVTQLQKYNESRIRVIEPDGITTLWEAALNLDNQSLIYDAVPSDVTGDGVLDLLYHLFDKGSGNALWGILDGRDGTERWPARHEEAVSGSGYGGSSFWELSGDGRPDIVICPRDEVEILDGETGTLLRNARGGYCQLSTIFDVNADSAVEIIPSGTYESPRVLDVALNEIWHDPSGRIFSGNQGGVALCPAGGMFIESPAQSPILVFWDGRSGSVVRELALASGHIFPTVEDAVENGARPGMLGNVSVKEDLTGLDEVGVLAGSTDGFLYAVNPCTGALLWSLDFGYPVGDAILADTDADGADEIVTTAADGFLYGIDDEVFPSPAWVYDTDPPSGITDTDVDSIETVDTLYATWAPVPSALRYEYAVVTAAGIFLTVPDFIDVGTSTSAESPGLQLQVGGRYYFAVRAVGSVGSSQETVSDGVTVIDGIFPEISISADPEVISPNGDGNADSTLLTLIMLGNRKLTSYRLSIKEGGSLLIVRDFGEFNLDGYEVTKTHVWDGKDEISRTVADGIYIAEGTVVDESGNESKASTEIRVLNESADSDTSSDGDDLDSLMRLPMGCNCSVVM